MFKSAETVYRVDRIFWPDKEIKFLTLCALDCPLSKGNQANHPKFERPNGKNTKSNFFFKSVQSLCPFLN